MCTFLNYPFSFHYHWSMFMNLIKSKIRRFILLKIGVLRKFLIRSVHSSLSLYLRNDIILFLCTLTGLTTLARLSHQFSLCITPHRGGTSTLIKVASGLLCFLADVCVYAWVARSRSWWLYAVIKNRVLKASAIIRTRWVIDRSRLEVTSGVFDDEWATVDIWGKMG